MKTAFILVGLLLAPSLLMAESIRCGSQLILRGSSSAELEQYCGKPIDVIRTVSFAGTGEVVRSNNGVVTGSTEEIHVEIWTYNFGPNQLMQRVRIENGLVTQIDSLGYGYNEP